MTIYARDNTIKVNYGQWNFRRASGSVHKGADVSTTGDATIRGTVAGKVKWARVVAKGAAGWGDTWQWGWFVWIIADDGTDHIYAHMEADSLRIKEGQRAEAGQALGVMGDTGNARGEPQGKHCHYEVRRNGVAIDPTPWCGGTNTAGVVWYGEGAAAEGGEGMKAFDVYGGDRVNVQGFGAADINDVQANNIPNGRYMVYGSELPLVGGYRGVLMRYNGRKLYAALLDGVTELTDITVEDAEARWGWYSGGDCGTVEAELAAERAKLAATEQALGAEKVARKEAEEARMRTHEALADCEAARARAENMIATAKTVRILEG